MALLFSRPFLEASFGSTSFPGFSPTRLSPQGSEGESPGNEVGFGWESIVNHKSSISHTAAGQLITHCIHTLQASWLAGG